MRRFLVPAIASVFAMTLAQPVPAQESPLVGNWKLVSFQVSLDNEPAKDQLGATLRAFSS